MPSLSTVISVTVFFGVVLALSRRPLTSLAMTLYLIGVVLLSSWIKMLHLGLALTLADVHFFLLRPLENFKLFLQYPLLGLLFLVVVAVGALCVWVGVRIEAPLKHLAKPRIGGWLRVTMGVA